MRFSVAVAIAGAAVAAAQSGTPSQSGAPSQTFSMDPVQSSMYACVDACDEGDVECQSHCIAVPAPNEDQVNETTKCMAECEQGNGTEEQTARYAACQQACITEHFYVTSEGTPSATGAPSNGNGNGNDNSDDDNESNSSRAPNPTQSGDDNENEEASETSGSPTGSGATSAPEATGSESPDSGASALVGSSAAFFGLVAAIFAL